MSAQFPSILFAAIVQQKERNSETTTDHIEILLDGFDEEETNRPGSEKLVEDLVELAQNPVNLNTADADELLQVPGLNLRKVRAILSYRKDVKLFENVEEIVNAKGIGERTLSQSKLYLTTNTIDSDKEEGKISFINKLFGGRQIELINRFQKTLQQRPGYVRPDTNGGYLGSPYRIYQRFRLTSPKLSINLTQDKDPGEPIRLPAGFDFISGHLAVKDIGILKKMIIGDFNISKGQGLLFWNGSSFGKSRQVTGRSINRIGRGIKPYTSSIETGFFRGIGLTLGSKLQFSGFYSKRARPATRAGIDSVRFPGGSGLHRTLSEISRKNSVDETVFGGSLKWRFTRGMAGLSAHSTLFDKVIVKGPGIHNRFDFQGENALGVSFNFRYLAGPAAIFGETARSKNGGMATIAGLEFAPDSKNEVVIAIRRYRPDFHSLYGGGFGEQSGRPQNESGIYLGLRHKLNRKITFSGYIDQYKFPAPRFGTRQPTRGFDWLGVVKVNVSSSFSFYLQARSETKEDEFETEDRFGRSVRSLGKTLRSGFRVHMEYLVNNNIRLRLRGEWVRARKAGEKIESGYLIYQDLRIIPGTIGKLDARLTLFETDSFTSRVFQFENDLLYLFSNPALFGRGSRFYLLMKIEPLPFVEIWMKYSATVFEDQFRIGSGLEEITGNRRSRFGVQTRIKF